MRNCRRIGRGRGKENEGKGRGRELGREGGRGEKEGRKGVTKGGRGRNGGRKKGDLPKDTNYWMQQGTKAAKPNGCRTRKKNSASARDRARQSRVGEIQRKQ
eukprot:6188898-Pleurochrysis_carterae.AAC.1